MANSSRIAKIFSKTGNEVKTIRSDEVVIDALCAYRDQLILSGDESLETKSKLAILAFEIEDVLERRFNR